MNLLNKLWTAFLFLLLIFALPVCTGNTDAQNDEKDLLSSASEQEGDEEENVPEKELEEKKVDPNMHHMARFIAGLAPEEGSPYAELSESPTWKGFAQQMDAQWQSIKSSKLPKIENWRDTELVKANEAGGGIFYPFSGPDFLHVSTFFPKGESIVMIGLEPIGSLPNFEEINKKSLGAYFNGVQKTLYSILNLSFFRTIAMAQDFTGKVTADIDGTLPILMLFMERTNYRVLNYEKIAITAEGEVIPAEEANADSLYRGTKLNYRPEGEEGEYRTLYYFAANLQDTPYSARSGLSVGGLEQRVGFKKFLENLDIQTTYIKSASYLMHRDNFSIIRNLILNKSRFYLQDDSGIPLKYFAGDQWNVNFYGSYFSPIPLFKVRYQADLRAAYQKGENVRPLPFGIGYQYRTGTSNLMYAEKK